MKIFEYTFFIILYLLLCTCKKEQTIEDIEFRYFKVIAKSGLRLRESPSVDSPKIDLLPYKHIGRIHEKTDKITTVSGKNGYWIKTRFNNKEGWIFSSFLLLSHTEEFQFYNDIELLKISNLTSTINIIPPSEKIINSFNIGTINIIQTKKNEDNIDILRVYFKNKNLFYYYADTVADWIKNHKLPINNILITGIDTCIECCGLYEKYFNLFSITSDIKYISFPMKNRKADCGEVIEGYSSEIINKFDPKTLTIFHKETTPKCEYSYDEGSINEFIEKNTLLSVIKLDQNGNFIELSNYKNDKISQDLNNEFNKSDLRYLEFYFK